MQPPAGAVARVQALQALGGLDEACQDRADYFAWKGLLLLEQQQPQEAANALEKALMLDPELGGAQLDYAQALAQIGQREVGRSMVLSVLGRSDIPQTLHDWLVGQPPQWGGDEWHTTWSVQQLVGHETNFNSAPASALVTLTLLGGSVPVVLGPNERPQAGMALLSTGAVQAVRRWGQDQLSLNFDTSARTNGNYASSNLQWLDGSALWSRQIGSFVTGGEALVTRLWMGGQSLYQENTSKWFVDHPLTLGGNACRYGTALEHSIRNYPSVDYLSGVYTGLELGSGCQLDETQVAVTGQKGVDHPQNGVRLGGTQGRDDFAVTGSHPLGSGTLILLGQWSRLQDQNAYSSLLGGVPRGIVRRGGRVEYDYPLNNRWAVLGYVETLNQDSNIGLFTLSDRSLYLGLRWTGGHP